MVNHVYLLGRLGKDPQIRHFTNDNAIAEFPLATTDVYKDKEGKFVEQTDWHNIKFPFKWMAERAEKNLKKGSMIFVEGKLKTRSYEDKDGHKRYVTEVVAESFKLLDKKENQQGDGGAAQGAETASDTASQRPNVVSENDFDDDLPF